MISSLDPRDPRSITIDPRDLLQSIHVGLFFRPRSIDPGSLRQFCLEGINKRGQAGTSPTVDDSGEEEAHFVNMFLFLWEVNRS